MINEQQPRISFLDFVAWEQDQTERHELIAGKIVPFLAASNDHETIVVNFISHLEPLLQPPCKIFGSGAIVQTVSRVAEDGYRPDVTVSCSKENAGSRLYVAEPKIVIEVLSPSNTGPKWNTKLFEYWNTTSIEQLLFVDSSQRQITSHLRDSAGRWNAEITYTNHDILEFAPLGVTMPLDRIYKNTDLAN